MKSTHQTLLALSVSCVLAASLAGCGVQITGVALDLPDSLEKARSSPPNPNTFLTVQRPRAPPLPKSWTHWA